MMNNRDDRDRDRAAEIESEISARSTTLVDDADLDPLLDRIGDARHVLIGEASHGTSEYYTWRAALTRRLIAECGFSFVAVEGDWPDCFRMNRWVKNRDGVRSDANDVLADFVRWPTWMWANEEVARFITWLRDHNSTTGSEVGFYGLDVYSLWDSLHLLRAYVEHYRPDYLEAAEEALACFEPFGEDPHAYARSTAFVPRGCEDEVVELLIALRRDTTGFDHDPEAALDAVQNAEVLRNAERYYRTMVGGGPESWNLRDHHMVDTLDRLIEHHGPQCRSIVWAHNTHVGDARATDMAAAGMVNVGQLVRERRADEGVFLVGMGGHHGTVTASRAWGGPTTTFRVPDAVPGTHEDLLRNALELPALLDTRSEGAGTSGSLGQWLETPRGHRAIGVVYNPERDHLGNWVSTRLGQRYDAFLAFDSTTALSPLPTREVDTTEEETFPWSA